MTNFINRSFIAIIYSSIFLFSLFYNDKVFLGLGIVLTSLVILEFIRISKLNFYNSFIGLTTYLMLIFFLENESKLSNILLAMTLIINLYLFFNLILNKSFKFKKKFLFLILIFHVILSLYFLFQLPFSQNNYNPLKILFLLVVIWSSDSAGYLIGIKFGKRKLMKSISPKKTIEGLIASLFFALIISLIFGIMTDYDNLLELSLIGLFTAFLGSIGDLIESKFKRQSGIKDSGKILKSHGGIYDRLDSLIFSAPFLYLMYSFNFLNF